MHAAAAMYPHGSTPNIHVSADDCNSHYTYGHQSWSSLEQDPYSYHFPRSMPGRLSYDAYSDHPNLHYATDLLHPDQDRLERTPPPPAQLFHYGHLPSHSPPYPLQTGCRRVSSPTDTSSNRSPTPPHDISTMQFNSAGLYGSPSDTQVAPYPPSPRALIEIFPGGGSGSCVMSDIQAIPDQIVDSIGDPDSTLAQFDHHHHLVHAGVEMDLEAPHDDDAFDSVQEWHQQDDSGSDQEYKPQVKSHSKRGRKRTLSNSSQTSPPRRATKRKPGPSHTPINGHANDSRRGRRARGANRPSQGPVQTETARPFPCPLAIYSCSSTFASKNEWKRHVSTQHIRLGYWRCDLCPPGHDADQVTVYYNDFNRKDLFTQHLRRMHLASPDSKGPSASPKPGIPPVTEDNFAAHQARCFKPMRTAPLQSSCLFCSQTFRGNGSWDERMEHVGRHLEKDNKGTLAFNEWRPDAELEQWLLKEGLIARVGDSGWKLGDGIPQQPADDAEEEDNDDDDADGELEE